MEEERSGLFLKLEFQVRSIWPRGETEAVSVKFVLRTKRLLLCSDLQVNTVRSAAEGSRDTQRKHGER